MTSGYLRDLFFTLELTGVFVGGYHYRLATLGMTEIFHADSE